MPAMVEKILLLIDDNELWQRFADAAKREIAENGNIEKMCAGFRDALFYATGKNA